MSRPNEHNVEINEVQNPFSLETNGGILSHSQECLSDTKGLWTRKR
jgi:hypothetical protein